MDKEEGILLIPSLAWGGTGAAGETGEDWGASPSEINLPVAGEGRSCLCPNAFWMGLRMVRKAGWLPHHWCRRSRQTRGRGEMGGGGVWQKRGLLQAGPDAVGLPDCFDNSLTNRGPAHTTWALSFHLHCSWHEASAVLN